MQVSPWQAVYRPFYPFAALVLVCRCVAQVVAFRVTLLPGETLDVLMRADWTEHIWPWFWTTVKWNMVKSVLAVADSGLSSLLALRVSQQAAEGTERVN